MYSHSVSEIRSETRCAIYTRRSVEQADSHAFSSIQAQRAICSSYIASQKPKGWAEVTKRYDDEGWSGSNLNGRRCRNS